MPRHRFLPWLHYVARLFTTVVEINGVMPSEQ